MGPYGITTLIVHLRSCPCQDKTPAASGRAAGGGEHPCVCHGCRPPLCYQDGAPGAQRVPRGAGPGELDGLVLAKSSGPTAIGGTMIASGSFTDKAR